MRRAWKSIQLLTFKWNQILANLIASMWMNNDDRCEQYFSYDLPFLNCCKLWNSSHNQQVNQA